MTTAALAAIAVLAAFALLVPCSATAIQPAADEYQFEIPGVGVRSVRNPGQVLEIRADRDRAGIAGETVPVDSPLEALGSTASSAPALLIAALASFGWVAARRHRLAHAE